MSAYTFQPQWREELHITHGEHAMTVEMTMGSRPTVYFPDKKSWQAYAPTWAKNKRTVILEALEIWCKDEDVMLVIDTEATE